MLKKYQKYFIVYLLCFIAMCVAIPLLKATTGGKKVEKDEVAYSFAVVGCNRLDKADTNTVNNPSTANVEQLKMTFSDIANIKPLPKFFFFAGDLVIGYAKDTAKLGSELRAWKQIYEKSELSKTGIHLVVTPGNHESMASKKEGKATIGTEECWINNMAPYIYGNNGPKSGTDSLTTDQSKLTYSFDYQNSHFIILNTDPAGREARVPSDWIAQDVAKNKNKAIFAIGHKPAYSAPDEKGLDEYILQRDKFWTALENGGAKAMITAHNHLYYKVQPHTGKTWQIIAGNGGSLLAKGLKPEETYFGFTLINMYKSGKIEVKSYGRNLPTQSYYAPIGENKTSVRETFWLNN